jgi:hypothetical protein
MAVTHPHVPVTSRPPTAQIEFAALRELVRAVVSAAGVVALVELDVLTALTHLDAAACRGHEDVCAREPRQLDGKINR